ncbi:hypothetical protein F1559_003510 [Cyanidiococcus yangmingshanensis]|uniref:J domain-containing protein n=1 Tax=Cyanidiococcus yangmingshanensis TaxID=2690220 RepID=A0A7J7IFB7_9RHOD|nr:hypothetical protein F1559_003510 [Cyanidiococcus yangmingshanensis]
METKGPKVTSCAGAVSDPSLRTQRGSVEPGSESATAPVPNLKSLAPPKEGDASRNERASKPSIVHIMGAVLILGAYAAGVVGFRYSRFMVGKEIHRGWGNYQRYSRERLEREILERLQQAAQRNWAEREARRREAFMAAEERARREVYRRYLEWERRFRGATKADAFAAEDETRKPRQAAPGTHYAELGVAPTATSVEIRKAYLERAKALHPDTQHRAQEDATQDNTNSSRERNMTAEERNTAFQRVVEAYQVLSNPESRRKYDAGVFGSWRR